MYGLSASSSKLPTRGALLIPSGIAKTVRIRVWSNKDQFERPLRRIPIKPQISSNIEELSEGAKSIKENKKLSRLFPKEKNRHVDKRKLTDNLGPTPRKPREVEFTHRCSIHLKNEKLFALFLIAIGDGLDDVATWARRHKEGTRVVLVPLHQNELSELTKAERKTFLPSPNQEGNKIPKNVREDLSKR